MNRPRLLDLFCGAGGAAMGYYRAGFDIVGVDLEPQPLYPFSFIRADAMTYPLDGFDVIHASPPCQAYCPLSAIRAAAKMRPRLIEPIRERLIAAGSAYVIENVGGAPLQGVLLCGSVFGLRVRRHRLFESNVHLWAPAPRHQHAKQGRTVGVYGHQGSGSLRPRKHGGSFIRAVNAADAGDALGIDWMPWKSLTQAIPPAYTEFIGKQLLRAL